MTDVEPPEIDVECLSIPGGSVDVGIVGNAERISLAVSGLTTSRRTGRVYLTHGEAMIVAKMLTGRAGQPGQRVTIPVHEWLSANSRDKHWAVHAEHIAVIRHAARAIAVAARLTPMDYVAITATPSGRSALRHDPGNLYPTVKAAVDGLVDAKVIPADTKTHVERITMNKPQPASGRDSEYLTLTIEAVTP